MHFLAGIGGYQAKPAINRMAMRIDKSRKQTLAVQIDALRSRRNSPRRVKQTAHGNDLIAANGNRFRIRVLRIAGEYLRVKENPLPRTFLTPHEQASYKKKCRNK